MTTATLRPDGILDASTATVTGAASLNAALADNSDSSYINIPAFGTPSFSFGTVSLPAGAVTKSINFRARTSAAAGRLDVSVGATGALAVGESFIPGSIATYTASPVATTMTQTQVDAIRGDLTAEFDAVTMKVYELYADLVYATVPVVTPTAPTGAIATTTSPTVTWTYAAGSDGGVQTAYRVRVFTAAQYGIGGFDPATSPSTYDTGGVVSAATSVVVGPLDNSTTYRAYVIVSQTINGSYHPSAWAFTGFSISLTTANISTVVGTPDNTNGRISVVVTRVTAGSPPTWTSVEVQRSDDGGTTWSYVRGANGAATSGSTFTIVDYEAGNGTTVKYRARATYLLSGLPVAGPWVSSSNTSWTAAVDWLKDVNNPTLNRTVMVVANPVLTRSRPQGVYSVIGRTDPVVVSDVRSLPSGPLQIVTATDQEAVDLLALTATDVLFFQPRPGARMGQMYIAIGEVPETPVVDVYNEPTRVWPLSFVQVTAPPDTT